MKSKLSLFTKSLLLFVLAFVLVSCDDDGQVDSQAAQGQAIADSISVTGIKLATALPASRDVAARSLDEPIEVTWVKAGETYDFVVEFTSKAELDFGVSFQLALVPYTEDDIDYDLGYRIMPLGIVRTPEEHITAGASTLRFNNISIPSNFAEEQNYLLLAFPDDKGHVLEDGQEVGVVPESTAEIKNLSLIKAIPVTLRPKTNNDINLQSAVVLEDVVSIENNVDEAIENGYTKSPFTSSELSLVSNNDQDANVDLKAYWVTSSSQEIPLYFQDEQTGAMHDTQTLTVPATKMDPEYPFTQPPPYIYTSKLYLAQADWTELLKYAGDLSQGQDAYAATIKYVLQPSSSTNQVAEDDVVEITQNTIQLTNARQKEKTSDDLLAQVDDGDYAAYENTAAARTAIQARVAAEPATDSGNCDTTDDSTDTNASEIDTTGLDTSGADDTDTCDTGTNAVDDSIPDIVFDEAGSDAANESNPYLKKRDLFDYKNEYQLNLGSSDKVALTVDTGVAGGADVIPVPTLDLNGKLAFNLSIFNRKIPFLDFQGSSAQSLDLVIDKNRSVSTSFTVENGSVYTLKFFGAKISALGSMVSVTTEKNANDPANVQKAKDKTNQGLSFQKLQFEKTFLQDKTLFQQRFAVGPVPISIRVGTAVKLPISIGIAPQGFGMALNAALVDSKGRKAGLNVIAQGGVDIVLATAGVEIDFMIFETSPFATTGIKFVVDSNKFKTVFFSQSELPMAAIRGKFSLFATTRLRYPCGMKKWFKVKWCKKTLATFRLKLYETPALVDKTGNNAIKLWNAEKTLNSIDLGALAASIK